MKIGIDARLMYETGVGRYERNLIEGLSRLKTNHQFFIYLTKEGYESFIPPGPNFIKRLADVHWHSTSEQVLLPNIFLSDTLDLLHEPYVTIPIFYSKRMVVTMHDTTMLTERTGRSSTLPRGLYNLKRFGLRMILSIGLAKAAGVIAVSESTRSDLIRLYPKIHEKITVISEGIDAGLIVPENTLLSKLFDGKPYLLIVGNAYPHKNLAFILDVFAEYIHSSSEDITLVLAGHEDYFYRRIEETAVYKKLGNRVLRVQPSNDTELSRLYRNASALLFPSRAEGFGLPAIEALALGTPVIVSDIPVFHEILGNNATYVQPGNKNAWIQALRNKNNRIRPDKRVSQRIQKIYKWDTTAKETLSFYEHCTRI